MRDGSGGSCKGRAKHANDKVLSIRPARTFLGFFASAALVCSLGVMGCSSSSGSEPADEQLADVPVLEDRSILPEQSIAALDAAEFAVENADALEAGAATEESVRTALGVEESDDDEIRSLESSTSTTEVTRTVYSNTTQGFSVLYDAKNFEVVESNGQEGMINFVYKGSKSGGGVGVFYNANWDGNPSVDQYFQEQIANYQQGASDFELLTQEPAEVVVLAGVRVYMLAGTYTDGNGNQIAVIDIVEPREDGAVYYFMITDAADYDAITTCLVETVATFRSDSGTYGATSVKATLADVQWRPGTGNANTSGGSGTGTSVVTGGDATGGVAGTTINVGGGGATGGSNLGGSAGLSNTPLTIGELVPTYPDDARWMIRAPEGWTIVATGDYETFAFEAFDPMNPDVRLVYYGYTEYNLSQYTQDAYEQLYQYGNANVEPGDAQIRFWAALPVLQPQTMANAIALLGEQNIAMCNYGQYSEGDPNTTVREVEVLNSEPTTGYQAYHIYGDHIVDEAIVSARVTLADGTVCRADYIGAVMTYQTEAAVGQSNMISCWGIIAPEDQFDEAAAALAPCIGSLSFSEQHVQDGIDGGHVFMSVEDYNKYIYECGAKANSHYKEYLESHS